MPQISDFFLRRPVVSGILISLLTIPITVVGSSALLRSQLEIGGRNDPHGVGAFVLIVGSLVCGVGLSLASGLVVGLLLNRRMK